MDSSGQHGRNAKPVTFSLITGQAQRFGKYNLEQMVFIARSMPRRQLFCSKKHPQACALGGRGPQSLRILHGTLWNLPHLQLHLHISLCTTFRRRATMESTLVSKTMSRSVLPSPQELTEAFTVATSLLHSITFCFTVDGNCCFS